MILDIHKFKIINDVKLLDDLLKCSFKVTTQATTLCKLGDPGSAIRIFRAK